MERKNTIAVITYNALYIALYVVLSLLFGDLSYGYNGIISLRIAEILVPLVIIDRKFAPGCILACLVANIFGGNVIDIVIGTLQSAISVLILISMKKHYLAIIISSLVCGLAIGLELYIFEFSAIGIFIIFTTFVSELIILLVGYYMFKNISSKISLRKSNK